MRKAKVSLLIRYNGVHFLTDSPRTTLLGDSVGRSDSYSPTHVTNNAINNKAMNNIEYFYNLMPKSYSLGDLCATIAQPRLGQCRIHRAATCCSSARPRIIRSHPHTPSTGAFCRCTGTPTTPMRSARQGAPEKLEGIWCPQDALVLPHKTGVSIGTSIQGSHT